MFPALCPTLQSPLLRVFSNRPPLCTWHSKTAGLLIRHTWQKLLQSWSWKQKDFVLAFGHKGSTVQMELYGRPYKWCVDVYLNACPIGQSKLMVIYRQSGFTCIWTSLYRPFGLRKFGRICADDLDASKYTKCIVHLDAVYFDHPNIHT